jgi:hypothetical protein
MGWTPLSAALNIFSPTQNFFSMYEGVVFLLLFLANLVNTLSALELPHKKCYPKHD